MSDTAVALPVVAWQSYRVDCRRLCTVLSSERDRQRASLRSRLEKIRGVKESNLAAVEQKLTLRREQSKLFIADIKRQASEHLVSARSKQRLI